MADFIIQYHTRVEGCRCNVIEATSFRDRQRKWRRYPTSDCSVHNPSGRSWNQHREEADLEAEGLDNYGSAD